MANEIRVRGNLVSGTLSVALASGDTTMSSAGLANLPAVTSAGHAVIIIENEIIYVTAHTASATTATILRAQEGTSAAAHSPNVAWVHGPVVSDYDSVLGYAQAVANQTGITSVVDLTSLSVTVTVPYAGHRVRITGSGLAQSSVADDIFQLSIQEGATILNLGKVLMRPANTDVTVTCSVVIVPTAASHTYKLTGQRAAGSGTHQFSAGAIAPAFILVEDLGPAL